MAARREDVRTQNAGTQTLTPPFGALAPSPAQDRWRTLAQRLLANYFGRRLASLLLSLAGGRSGRAYDVVVFGSQKARLHPADNICEKRVYLTPQFWEPKERAALADAIARHGSGEFIFVDVGANVGLYSLFARAECAKARVRLRALCIEPDREMQDRLNFNVAASGAAADVRLFRCAASDRDGAARFSIDRACRGLSRIDPNGNSETQTRPLLSMIEEAGLSRIDALKIDVEGHEFPVLDLFFREAARALWPALVILEHNHGARQPAPALCERLGYRRVLTTWRNSVFALTEGQ